MKKGFTLIELLGVIAILGLLIVITATSGFGLFDKTKKSINAIEEDNLLEAGKTFLVDVDYGLANYDEDENSSEIQWTISAKNYIKSCNDIDCLKEAYRKAFIDDEISVDVSYLESHGYFNDKKDKCNDNSVLFLKIKTDDNGNVIDYSARKESSNDIICEN